MLTKNALGNMQNRYSAVLKKCRLLNVFGSLAVATMLSLGGLVGDALAVEFNTDEEIRDAVSYDFITVTTDGDLDVNSGGDVTVTQDTTVNEGGRIEINVGTYNTQGITTVDGGSISIDDSGAYTATGETKLINVGSITVGTGTYNAGATTVNGGSDITVQTDGRYIAGATTVSGVDSFISLGGGTYEAKGNTEISDGGLIHVNTGTYEATGATTVSGKGYIRVSGGAYEATGDTEISDGGYIKLEGGTYAATGTTTVSGADSYIHLDGGLYKATGATTVSEGGSFYLDDGEYAATGTTLVQGGSSIAVNTDGTYTAEGKTTVSGLNSYIDVNGGTYTAGETLVEGRGYIKVNFGGTYTATGTTTVSGEDSYIYLYGGSYKATDTTTVSNSGFMLIEGGTHTAGATTVSDGGYIDIAGGRFNAGSATTVSDGGNITVYGGRYTATGATSVSGEGSCIYLYGGKYNAKSTTTVSDGGELGVDGGTYNATGATSVSGEGSCIYLYGGKYNAKGTTKLSDGGYIWVNDGTYNAGATTVNEGGYIQVDVDGTYDAKGATTVNKGGEIYINNGGAYTAKGLTTVSGGFLGVGDPEAGGGEYIAQGTTTVSEQGGLIVGGEQSKYTAKGATTVSGGFLGVLYGGEYTAQGTTTVSGTDDFPSEIHIDGGKYNAVGQAIEINDGGRIRTGGYTVITGDSTYPMLGEDALEAKTLTLNEGGVYITTGTMVSENGSINLNEGSLYFAGSTGVIDNGSINLNGGEYIAADTVVMGGTINIHSGLYAAGSYDAEWVDTAMSNAGLSADGLGILSIYRPNSLYVESGKVLVGGGTGDGISFGPNSLLVVHAGNLGESYALVSPTMGTEAGAKLLISNVAFTDRKATVNVAEADSLTLANGSWGCGDTAKTGEEAVIDTDTLYFDNAFTVAESYIFDAAEDTYAINVKQLNAAEVYAGTGLDPKLAAMIDEAVASGTLPELLGNLTKELSPEDFAKVMEGVSKSQVNAGIAGVTGNVSNLATTNTTNRASFIFGSNGGSTMDQVMCEVLLADSGTFSDVPNPIIADAGTASGLANGLAIWVQPMYQSVSADGLTSGNFNYGYDADIYGASLGVDNTVENSFRYGLAMHVGGGSSESNNSDFSRTENDFEFFGATLYAGYVLDNLSLSGDVNYTLTRNNLSQEAGAYNVSTDDFDSIALSVGARAEYKIATDIVDIIPYLGARLSYFETSNFDIKDTAAATVFHTSASYATTFAVPMGVAFSKSFALDSVELIPRASLGVQFTTGDLDVEQRTGIVGGTAQTMESEVFDAVTFMGGLGLDAKFDNVTLGLDYNLGASENVMSHQISAMARYAF